MTRSRQKACKFEVSRKRSVLGSGECWEWVAAGVGGERLSEVLEERALSLAAGGGGGEGAFGEPFGLVVGRFDGSVGDECPERGPDLEQVVGEAPVVAGALALAAGVFEQLPKLLLDRFDGGPEACAVLMLALVGAPRGEHAAGELKAVCAEGLLLGEPLAVAAKVALQMRPAHLQPARVQMLVAGPAV